MATVISGSTGITLPDNGSLSTSVAGAMVIDSAGIVTQPLQPAFQVRPASTQSNLPLNTDTTILWGTEVADQNSDFSSNTFTAPVSGKYQLNLHLYFNQLNQGTAIYDLKIVTHNYTFVHVIDMRPFDADAPNWSFGVSVLAEMDANDTAYIVVKPYNSGSALADITTASHFSGFLAC
jgi:hypothetical protein